MAFVQPKVSRMSEWVDCAHFMGVDDIPAYSPPVIRFAKAILGSDTMRNLFEKIFVQVNTDPEWADPKYVVTDFNTFFCLLDTVVQKAPPYSKARRADGTIIDESPGTPMSQIFDLLSNTSAAYDLFRLDAFNAELKNLLDSWGSYLMSPDSNSTLNNGPQGWFSEDSMKKLNEYLHPLTFETTYVCPDPPAESKGFQSWDAFFTRALQPLARPILLPDNAWVIYNPCESTTVRYTFNVKLHDKFWLKSQPYSLYDMLGGTEEDAQPFVGGSVYQGYLSSQDYHRWHSPIKGTITKTVVLPGTYYAALPDDGEPDGESGDYQPGDPHGAMDRSVPWLSVSATRALIFIQSDNHVIGLVCFIAIGMGEVSTCDVTVQVNQCVKSGEELGMFHFGGSAFCLIFGPQAQTTFETFDGKPIKEGSHYWVNAIIGRVAEKRKGVDSLYRH